MAYVLTKNQKATLDYILALAGTIVGYLVQNAFFGALPVGIGPLVGAVSLYTISDLTAVVNTGTVPAIPTIAAQAVAAIKLAQSIPNLTPAEQQGLALALTVAEAQAAKTG